MFYQQVEVFKTKNNNFEDIEDNYINSVSQNNYNNNNQKTWIAKADYELPITEDSKFEAGARYDFRNNITENLFYDVTAGQDLDERFSNKTDYTEKILAIYAQFKSKFDNFGLSIGIRNEHQYNCFQWLRYQNKSCNTYQ